MSKGPIGTDRFGRKIYMASRKKAYPLRKSIDTILTNIGHPEAFVSDESRLWDFNLTKSKMRRLSKKWGIPGLKGSDLLIDIAKRIKHG